ncbi:MAG: SDR family NAD(P)-dependent oxidoreductase [Gammaproteobacteria bacterium]
MPTVVITGSTKGIGRSLADNFISRAYDVVISSRNEADAIAVAEQLNQTDGGKAIGLECDVSSKAALQHLWDEAVALFGSVDIWINNAGHASSRHKVHELPESIVHTLIDSNLKGATFGSQIAINGFRQQGSGALYNTLGGSFDGKRLTPNMGVYSSTKAGIHLLSKYLVAENDNENIIIGMISPGLLITENWFDEQKHLNKEEWAAIRPTLNILCDHVEEVTPWLVRQIIDNKKSGTRIAWITGAKLAKRFFDAKVLGKKRDLFSRYGL